MFVTLVAVLCHVLPGGPGDCVEEIVTDSNQSNITFQSCVIQGQIGIAKWMSEHPIYHANWTLQRYKCAPGHYELHVKAWPMKETAWWMLVILGSAALVDDVAWYGGIIARVQWVCLSEIKFAHTDDEVRQEMA
jgi:hypothetical protein